MQALARGVSWQLGSAKNQVGACLILTPRHLVLLHRGDSVTECSLAAQARHLERSCADLLYVSASRAADLCRSLGSRLRDHLGSEARQAAFVAIPRGGQVVLDQLAPWLELRAEQRNAPEDPDRLLVVVDDCAISGLRFRQFLAGCTSRRILFAHLYSHPDLRAAIEAREPRVLACVSAEDLHDLSPSISPEHARRRHERIARGERYWIGSTEALCFPWNEPDRSFWNPATRRQERAWKVVPPEFCSKNVPPPGTTPIPIQLQPEGKGPLRPTERVVFGELEGGIVLGDLESGCCFGLEKVAADLWRALLIHGHPEEAVAAVQAEYDVPAEVLRKDARTLYEDLEARGLIEWI